MKPLRRIYNVSIHVVKIIIYRIDEKFHCIFIIGSRCSNYDTLLNDNKQLVEIMRKKEVDFQNKLIRLKKMIFAIF